MEKIYGIHEGSIHEGGCSRGIFYRKIDDAIKQAIESFEKMEKESYEMFYERDRDHYKDYKWRKCNKVENRWHNTVDEIVVIEVELI